MHITYTLHEIRFFLIPPAKIICCRVLTFPPRFTAPGWTGARKLFKVFIYNNLDNYELKILGGKLITLQQMILSGGKMSGSLKNDKY